MQFNRMRTMTIIVPMLSMSLLCAMQDPITTNVALIPFFAILKYVGEEYQFSNEWQSAHEKQKIQSINTKQEKMIHMYNQYNKYVSSLITLNASCKTERRQENLTQSLLGVCGQIGNPKKWLCEGKEVRINKRIRDQGCRFATMQMKCGYSIYRSKKDVKEIVIELRTEELQDDVYLFPHQERLQSMNELEILEYVNKLCYKCYKQKDDITDSYEGLRFPIICHTGIIDGSWMLDIHNKVLEPSKERIISLQNITQKIHVSLTPAGVLQPYTRRGTEEGPAKLRKKPCVVKPYFVLDQPFWVCIMRNKMIEGRARKQIPLPLIVSYLNRSSWCVAS